MTMQFLKNFWYPIIPTKAITENKPYATYLLGEPLVLFRGADGQILCLHDACPHFGTPLSLGVVKAGNIECPYHGWQFGEGGLCRKIPCLDDHVQIPRNARCRFAYLTKEHGGVVWVWTGNPETPAPFKGPEGTDTEGWVHDVIVLEQETPHHIMIAGTVDFTHIAFMHMQSIGKMRRVQNPMVVELDQAHGFRSRLKDTSRDDGYNDMIFSFEPPCHIQIATTPKPGWRLLANQYVVPLTETRTRLIVFTCRNWLTWNPLVTMRLRKVSTKILQEDSPIQIGQYHRHRTGDGGWDLPIKQDVLCVRYRQWYESQARQYADVLGEGATK